MQARSLGCASLRFARLRYAILGVSLCLAISVVAEGQDESAKAFKANCVLCHSANGSGDSATGKALKAKDLRSEEVQTQTDDALAATISKGKGKMPAFSAKLKGDDIAKMVAYVRELARKK